MPLAFRPEKNRFWILGIGLQKVASFVRPSDTSNMWLAMFHRFFCPNSVNLSQLINMWGIV